MTNPSKSHPCDFKKKVSHVISDTTGSGEKYIDTYYLCTMTGHRLKKIECMKCKRVPLKPIAI